MRLLYGTPPEPGRSRSLEGRLWPEEVARRLRIEREKRALGEALWDLIAPLCGEDPIK